MRIALVVPPFITVPPERYGGTELFVAELAEGLRLRGHSPVVYTVGASRVDCEIKWRHMRGHWPIDSALESSLEDLEHTGWACRDAARDCDIIHLNNAPGLVLSPVVSQPFAYTLHHPHDVALSHYYAQFPEVRYVAISRRQAELEPQLPTEVVHHGLNLSRYRVAGGKRDYLCFIGRVAPIKGAHTAIEVARRVGMPLKMAGEVQPMFREYWERRIRPQIDGHNVEFVGEVDLQAKNELLAGARAVLFPIDWDEPFGLVMIEAMACGVQVLAYPRGAAPEVVANGESGWLCRDAADMARRVGQEPVAPVRCRAWVERHFSRERMVEQYVAIYESLGRAQSGAPAPRPGVKLPLAS